MMAKGRKSWCMRAAPLAVVFLLGACEGVGIVATDDPYTKLSQSVALRDDGRIMQARRMLDQAIVTLEQRGDKAGLAKAYREYGVLALVAGSKENPVILRNPNAPLKPTGEEIELSDQYIKRAIDLARDTNQLYLVANAYLVLGDNQVLRGKPQDACPYYDLAQTQFLEAVTKQPGVPVNLPAGIKYPSDLASRAKQEAGCQH